MHLSDKVHGFKSTNATYPTTLFPRQATFGPLQITIKRERTAAQLSHRGILTRIRHATQTLPLNTLHLASRSFGMW